MSINMPTVSVALEVIFVKTLAKKSLKCGQKCHRGNISMSRHVPSNTLINLWLKTLLALVHIPNYTGTAPEPTNPQAVLNYVKDLKAFSEE